MSYTVLKALAQWYSRAVQALIRATSSVEDTIVHGIAKLENAAWDVEQRMHDQAMSAANQLANKEHEAIQKAHDAAVASLVRARLNMNASAKALDGKIAAVYEKLDKAIELHVG